MVRLQHEEATMGDLKSLSLHPTMVRLQPAFWTFPPRGERSSPSHYGSTATVCRDGYRAVPAPSPSHYGSTATQEEKLIFSFSFKSPSHYGSTATFSYRHTHPGTARSPSHYGSTATIWKKPSGGWPREVSIPLWFDCNLGGFEGDSEEAPCLHPTMVRLQL